MREIWKAVKGYEGLYEVSSLGRVKSFKRKGAPNDNILKSRTNNYRYNIVCLCNGKTQKYYLVHRLVAIAFIHNTNNYPQVNHKDGDKANNRIENLEWVTLLQNVRHAYKNGLMSALKGESSGRAKLTNSKVKLIRNLRNIQKLPIAEIAKMFDVSCMHICHIANYNRWTHIQ